MSGLDCLPFLLGDVCRLLGRRRSALCCSSVFLAVSEHYLLCCSVCRGDIVGGGGGLAMVWLATLSAVSLGVDWSPVLT